MLEVSIWYIIGDLPPETLHAMSSATSVPAALRTGMEVAVTQRDYRRERCPDSVSGIEERTLVTLLKFASG